MSSTQCVESRGSGDSGDLFPLFGNSIVAIINSNQNIFSKEYVAFDFEWSQGSSISIFAAAFVDSQGSSKVLHLSASIKNSCKRRIRGLWESLFQIL
jgi:hypothetical protein